MASCQIGYCVAAPSIPKVAYYSSIAICSSATLNVLLHAVHYRPQAGSM